MIQQVVVWLCLLVAPVGFGAPGAANGAPGAVPGPPTRARVTIVQQPGAMVAYSPRLEVVRPMVESGLTNLTGKATPTAAWRSLVSTQDTVGIKVHAAPGATSGTRPAVVEALVLSLLEAGLPARQIVIWDRHLGPLQLAGFGAIAERHGVRVAGSQEAGYDPSQFYDTPLIGQLVWGDHEFGQTGEGTGRRSYVSKLVSKELTKIVNVTPLLNHNLAGVSGNLYTLAMGSVDNTLRFANDGDRLTTAIPEIYALPILGDRVVLNVVDALLAQYYGEEKSLLHYSAVLNELRFSTDPIALDVLSINELERQRQLADAPAAKTSLLLYQNATLLEIGLSEPRNIQVEIVK